MDLQIMKKGIILDMDGTVWDSSENVARAWTVKVHEAGYTDKEVTRKDIQSLMGKPMDVIADTLFTYTEKAPSVTGSGLYVKNMKMNIYWNMAGFFMTGCLIR